MGEGGWGSGGGGMHIYLERRHQSSLPYTMLPAPSLAPSLAQIGLLSARTKELRKTGCELGLPHPPSPTSPHPAPSHTPTRPHAPGSRRRGGRGVGLDTNTTRTGTGTGTGTRTRTRNVAVVLLRPALCSQGLGTNR